MLQPNELDNTPCILTETDIREAQIINSLARNLHVVDHTLYLDEHLKPVMHEVDREALAIRCAGKLYLDGGEINVWSVSPRPINTINQIKSEDSLNQITFETHTFNPDTQKNSTKQTTVVEVDLRNNDPKLHGLKVTRYPGREGTMPSVNQPVALATEGLGVMREPTDLVVFLNCHAMKPKKAGENPSEFYGAALC